MKKSERGQAMILIALAILALIALTAMGVDGGIAYLNRRRAQNAADAAALAAALAEIRGEDSVAAAFAQAAANNYNNDGVTNIVEVHIPPISGPYIGENSYIQVIIASNVDPYFAPVVGITQITNRVNAVARAKPGSMQSMFLGNAIVSLSLHDCNAFFAHGTQDLRAIGGGIYVNSDCQSYAFRQVGNSGHVQAPSIKVVGKATYKSGSVTPVPSMNAPALSPIIYPNPVCAGDALKTDNTLSAGTVSGDFPPSGVTQLESGVFCITGDFVMHGHDDLIGTGIVLVLQSGGMTLNGTSHVDLSAPTEGPFAGLLIFMPPGNSSAMTINGTNDSRFTGSMLAPDSHITLLGTGAVDGFNSQVIGYTVEWGGTGDGIIRYNDKLNYDAQTSPAIQLVR